jgi:hypothetical protein
LSLNPIIQTYTVFLPPLHLTTAIAGCQPLVVQFAVKPDSKIQTSAIFYLLVPDLTPNFMAFTMFFRPMESLMLEIQGVA